MTWDRAFDPGIIGLIAPLLLVGTEAAFDVVEEASLEKITKAMDAMESDELWTSEKPWMMGSLWITEKEPGGASGSWDEKPADDPWYKKIFGFFF